MFDFSLNLRNLLEATLSIFIIMDPIGGVPIFMGLTENKTGEERKRLFKLALWIAYILLLIFTFSGTLILGLFNITLTDFQIAGGFLLLAVSLKILTVGHYKNGSSREDVGVVPLACPLLVGPGAITAALVANAFFGTLPTFLAVTISFLLSSIVFFFAEGIYRFLGKTGSEVFSKIIAILMASIAIQYIRVGFENVMRGLLHP